MGKQHVATFFFSINLKPLKPACHSCLKNMARNPMFFKGGWKKWWEVYVFFYDETPAPDKRCQFGSFFSMKLEGEITVFHWGNQKGSGGFSKMCWCWQLTLKCWSAHLFRFFGFRTHFLPCFFWAKKFQWTFDSECVWWTLMRMLRVKTWNSTIPESIGNS